MNFILSAFIIFDLFCTRGVTRLFLIGFKYTRFELFSFMSFAAGIVFLHRILAVTVLVFILLFFKSRINQKNLIVAYLSTAIGCQGLILDAYIRGGRMIKHTPHIGIIIIMTLIAAGLFWREKNLKYAE